MSAQPVVDVSPTVPAGNYLSCRQKRAVHPFELVQRGFAFGAVNVDDEQITRLAASQPNVQVVALPPPRANAVKVASGIVHAAAAGGFLAAPLTGKDRQAVLSIGNGVGVQ